MTTKTDNAAEIGLHVFERAGLGKAPFRCVGVATVTYQACPGAPVQVGGSCDFCGTGIMIHCYIVGSDGKKFKVGSDCVAKTGDAGLIKSYKNRPEVRQAKRDAAARKANRVVDEIKSLLADETNRAKLAAIPSDGPSANQLERLEWIIQRCGASGKARWLKVIKHHLATDTTTPAAGAADHATC